MQRSSQIHQSSMSVWMTFILCAIKDACAAKQAHKWSIICRQRCEWMLHPVIETSNSSIKVTLSLTYTIANTHLLAGLFLSPKVANRHCARLVFLWHVHKHTDSSAAERLVRVSHSGARGRRRAKQSSVWWLLPQIVTTSTLSIGLQRCSFGDKRLIQFQHNGENGLHNVLNLSPVPLCEHTSSSSGNACAEDLQWRGLMSKHSSLTLVYISCWHVLTSNWK